MECPQCHTEIQRLHKSAGALYWILSIIMLVIFFPVALLMWVAYVCVTPDRCPVCNTKLKIATVTENGVRVKKFATKGWLD